MNNSALTDKWRLYLPKEADCETFIECVQNVTTPNLSIPPVGVANNQGYIRGNEVGTSFVFSQFPVRFKIDSNWDSYAEIYSWMVNMANYQTGVNKRNIGTNRKPESMMLFLNDTEGDKIVKQFKLIDAWPSELSEIEMSYTESGAVELFCTVVFFFNKMLFCDKNGDPIGGIEPTGSFVSRSFK